MYNSDMAGGTSPSRQRLRVGVIGCGTIAQVMHLPYLTELSDRFDVVAISDLSPTTLHLVGNAFRVERRFERWEELLEEPLDAAFVLTSGPHERIATSAAERGLHVFVEKPMSMSDRKSTRLNYSHIQKSRMPSSA